MFASQAPTPVSQFAPPRVRDANGPKISAGPFRRKGFMESLSRQNLKLLAFCDTLGWAWAWLGSGGGGSCNVLTTCAVQVVQCSGLGLH